MANQRQLPSMGLIPPSDAENEQLILGSFLLEPNTLVNYIDQITVDMFYKEEHRLIFESMVLMFNKSIPIDLGTIVSHLRTQKALDKVGGPVYLVEICNRIASTANIESYLATFKEHWMRRTLITTSTSISAFSYDLSRDIHDIIGEYEQGMSNIANSTQKKQERHVSLALIETINIIQNNKHGKLEGHPSGITQLDNVTTGYRGGELYIFAARPGMGKTSFILSNIHHSCIMLGVPTAIFSIEMPERQVMERLISMHTEVPMHRIRGNKCDQSDMEKMINHTQKLHNAPLYIDDSPTLSIIEFRAKARRMKMKYDIQQIFIDYLQLMSANTKGGNREQEIATISRGLKAIAKELNIPIIALAQLSRSVETRGGNKKPMLSDLRECLATETSLIYTNKNIQCNTNSRINLLSLNKEKVVNMNSVNIPKSKNEVFRLKTGTGRFIDCTAEHPILTTSGYKKLRDITPLDSIALAKNFTNKDGVYIEESKFIGWMLGNGCMYGYNVPSFITIDKVISDLFVEFIQNKFGFSPKDHPHYKTKVYQWDITKNSVRTPEGNPVTNWLKSKDLWGRKAKDKCIPQWFMETADEQSIFELIQGLWETDGCVAIGIKRDNLQYSTNSYFMATQILYLLSKIGIIAYLDNGYMSNKATSPNYKIRISDSNYIAIFKSKIKLDGYKGDKLSTIRIKDRQTFYGNKLSRDTTLEIAEILSSLKMNIKSNFRVQTHGNRRLTTCSLKKVLSTNIEQLEKYRWLLSEDIHWDIIDSITPMGEMEVFDRSVPGTNNFVVNGIIVHNSGAIEQDADVISFIYRPEYYGIETLEDGSSTNGYAEVIVSKNRSGGLGEFPCGFSHNTTLFHNPIDYSLNSLNEFQVKAPF